MQGLEQEDEKEKEEECKMSSRGMRLKQMKAHKHYKDYGEDEDDACGDLNDLKNKYRDRRRNREQISEIEDYSFDDLIKGMDDHQEDILTYQFEADDDDEAFPSIPLVKKESILLDINHLSAKLANIVEEDDSEDDEEKCFQTVEYQTDSDCDSNDSVVVKKEIVKNVTVNEINDMEN
eukprot:UN09984